MVVQDAHARRSHVLPFAAAAAYASAIFAFIPACMAQSCRVAWEAKAASLAKAAAVVTRVEGRWGRRGGASTLRRLVLVLVLLVLLVLLRRWWRRRLAVLLLLLLLLR